ncbi:MAG: glycosyltransferase [Chloroflexota bacterium]
MTQDQPTVSVIIHAYGVDSIIADTLDALHRQSFPALSLEIIVFFTEHNHAFAELRSEANSGAAIHILHQPGATGSLGRNLAADIAQGDVLVFLDQNAVPEPDFVQAHVDGHTVGEKVVVIGAYQLVATKQVNSINIGLRSWWVDRLALLKDKGHRFSYRDLIGGNFSLRRDLFQGMGQFDDSLQYGQDYEFGIRLIERGIQFQFAHKASCAFHYHQSVTTLFTWAKEEGQLFVRLQQQYPNYQFAPRDEHLQVPKSARWTLFLRLLHWFAFSRSFLGLWVERHSRRGLRIAEKYGFHYHWRILFRALSLYWYWFGMSQAMKPADVTVERQTRSLLAVFLDTETTRRKPDPADISVNLEPSLELAEALLDDKGPSSINIYYGQQFLGHIPPQIGAEPIAGRHLRTILTQDLAVPFLQALAFKKVRISTGGPYRVLPGSIRD